KKKGKTLAEENKKWLLLFGSSEAEEKKALVFTNLWREVDLLMVSPVMTVGNDFSAPGEFSAWMHTVFGLFRGSIDAAVTLQMLGRMREVQSGVKRVIVCQSDRAPKPSNLTGKRKRIAEVIKDDWRNVREEYDHLIETQCLV